MRILDGLKLKGRPAEIPDCPRDNLPQFFVDVGYKVGAEIGVHKGAFTEKFCKAGLKMYAIDPWMAFPGQGRSQMVQDRQDFLYGHTQRTLAPYKNCTIIRATSMDAAKQFKDESLDFVYIDGDHSFRYFAQDIVEWPKKVRPGGMVAGHDYFYTNPKERNVVCHVQPVLDAYIKVSAIENFYIFGKIENAQNRDDTCPSWMFIKG